LRKQRVMVSAKNEVAKVHHLQMRDVINGLLYLLSLPVAPINWI
jgi:hypothetical protein